MISKHFILTKEGRDAGYTIDSIISNIDHIVCATEYDIHGQSSLYANSYFKGVCRVGVSIYGNEEEIDAFTKYMIERKYLEEDK